MFWFSVGLIVGVFLGKTYPSLWGMIKTKGKQIMEYFNTPKK